jgi:hypothetical protein
MEQVDALPGKESFNCLNEFDAVLFADKFHDAHEFGFSVWVHSVGWRAIGFYILCIVEFISNTAGAFKKRISYFKHCGGSTFWAANTMHSQIWD